VKAILSGNKSSVFEVIQLIDGRIASSSLDKTIRIWNVLTGVCDAVLEGHLSSIEGLCQLGNGRLISSEHVEESIREWNLTTYECEKMIRVDQVPRTKKKLKQLNSSEIIVSIDNKLRAVNIDSGVCEQEYVGHTGEINGLTILKDGGFATASDDKTIRIW